MAKKKKINIVYSTNPDYSYDFDDEQEADTLEANQQSLYVSIDRKKRAGKEVTLVEGFIGQLEDLKDLAKILKSKCGVGGAVKDGDILIQGKFKEKVYTLLKGLDYNVKQKGGN